MRRMITASFVSVVAGLCSGIANRAAVAGAAETPELPVAVARAQATDIPSCTVFVDASSKGGAGSADNPYGTIAVAVEAADDGAVICVAEGTYPEKIAAGEKAFTLAGGFQSGSGFKVRDSADYITKAQGKGGTFLRVGGDTAPGKGKLTAVDGFEISGYSQAIVRDYWESQRFDVTNTFFHDNTCADRSLTGGALSLANVSGVIRGNVFQKNSCGRGGAIALNDGANENTVTIEANLIDGNAGTEPDSAHGGAVYVFGNTLVIRGNAFLNNRVTQWGGGLYVGAYLPGNQPTTATLAGNTYRGNRAGNGGGGFFCDDGATCNASHEVYAENCGGNVLLDGGAAGSGPTTARFDHVTNVRALDPSCKGPGPGVFIDTYEGQAADTYTFANSLFWGNGDGRDIAAVCSSGCGQISVTVTDSMVQTAVGDGSIKVTFGDGIVPPADPMFVAPEAHDYSLQLGSPAAAPGGAPLGAAQP